MDNERERPNAICAATFFFSFWFSSLALEQESKPPSRSDHHGELKDTSLAGSNAKVNGKAGDLQHSKRVS